MLILFVGTQEFSKRIAAALKPNSILLNSPVREIRHDGNGCYVESARGSFTCKRVIISIPTPLYREITFSPPLPAAKAKLATSTKLGCYGKAICVYDRPWWRDGNLCGLLQSATGPAGVFRDTSVEKNSHFSITCFMVGEPARQWGRLGKVERDKMVLDQIEKGFGQFAKVEKPNEIVEQRWQNEQWSQGCPCPVMPPGVMTELGGVLRDSVGKLHFVGTETAYEWKGYMDGAVRSGERGAKEVLAALEKARL
jgi:monoamine oxidase